MTTATEIRRRYSAELGGDWAVFAKIAGYFVSKVKLEDWDDFHQDLLVEMAKVKVKYDAKGKTLTEAGLMVVARYELLDYWVKRRYRLFGLNCRYCTIEQRQECQTTRLPSECPKGKARPLLSLDKPRGNGNGDKLTKLSELIADPKSIDPTKLDARLDARRILQVLPKRLVKIGYKIYAGIPLEKEEKKHLKHWRKVHPAPFDWRQEPFRKNPQRMTRPQLSMHRKVSELNLYVRKLYLDEGILELLRQNPQGMTRTQLCRRLQVLVRKLNQYLNRLIKEQQVTAVKREKTRGRPVSSLLFIAGAEIPEQKNVAAERDERIRQAYLEGWSIRRIAKELHHTAKTSRRALYGIKAKRR